MEISELNVVTGAFGYTGKYIASRLLSLGKRVRTLTGHPDRPDPFGGRVEVFPFNFDNRGLLVESLRGAVTLYNTYWIRFSRGQVTFDKAIENTRVLLGAAREAGVQRIVHVSITNASQESPLPYFRGKGIVEEAVLLSGLSYVIIRPTVVFGAEDILINNIASFLRRFPVFPIFGSGDYYLQPVFVEDLAEMAVGAAHEEGNIVFDAVGPETYTFDELVRVIARAVGSSARICRLSPWLAPFLSRLAGYRVKDVVLTRDEVRGLMSNLLVSLGAPTGHTRLTEWLSRNADTVGTAYASELDRHYR